MEEEFQPQNHLEKCALTQWVLWHLQCTFSVGRSPGKWNPSFHRYQKTKKPEVPEVPEVPENQKNQSRNPFVKFEEVKVGFSEMWLH